MEARAKKSVVIPENLDYPVICFAQDTSVVVARDVIDITRCNATAFWKNRYFENLLVVDAAGRAFRVESAHPDPDVSFADQFVARFLNRRFRVSFRLNPEGRMSLAEIKRTLIAWIEKAPHQWTESRDVGEWKRVIASSRSVVGLARLLDGSN